MSALQGSEAGTGDGKEDARRTDTALEDEGDEAHARPCQHPTICFPPRSCTQGLDHDIQRLFESSRTTRDTASTTRLLSCLTKVGQVSDLS